MAGATVSVLPTGTKRAEVPTQGLQRKPFRVDLAHGAKPKLAQKGDRWAPPLQGVLEHKGSHQGRKCEPTLVHGRTEDDTRERQSGCIRFKSALDVPLAVQLGEALVDALGVCSMAAHAFIDPTLDCAVGTCGSVARDALGRVRQHSGPQRSAAATVPVHRRLRTTYPTHPIALRSVSRKALSSPVGSQAHITREPENVSNICF